MKAYQITGILRGCEFETFVVGESREDVIQRNKDKWQHMGVKNIYIEKLNKEQLVDHINSLL